MLVLLYTVKDSSYALNAELVAEVIPRVRLKKLPHMPAFVSGVFNYHGTMVPVVDMSEMLEGEISSLCLGTRIILVKYPGTDNSYQILGLIAEKVAGVARVNKDEMTSSGIKAEDAPYLGQVTHAKEGIIQFVEIDKLLPESLKKTLFNN